MSDPSGELQAALLSMLTGSIAAVGDRVFDEPPVNGVFPYLTLGDCQVLPDKYDCVDGVEAYPLIHVWSRDPGFAQTKAITKQVLALLDDQDITVTGFNVVVFQFDSVHYLRDPDGLTRHSAITFHTFITPA